MITGIQVGQLVFRTLQLKMGNHPHSSYASQLTLLSTHSCWLWPHFLGEIPYKSRKNSEQQKVQPLMKYPHDIPVQSKWVWNWSISPMIPMIGVYNIVMNMIILRVPIMTIFQWSLLIFINIGALIISYPPTPADARGSALGNSAFDSCFGLQS